MTFLCLTVLFCICPALSLSGQLVTSGLVWCPSQRTALGFSFCSEMRRKETTTNNIFKETGKNICKCFKLWGKKLTKGVSKKQIPYFDRNSPHSTSLFSSLSFAFRISCIWSCSWLSWSFNILLYLFKSMFPFASRSFSSSRMLTSAGDIRVALAEWLSSDLLQNSTGEKTDGKMFQFLSQNILKLSSELTMTSLSAVGLLTSLDPKTDVDSWVYDAQQAEANSSHPEDAWQAYGTTHATYQLWWLCYLLLI